MRPCITAGRVCTGAGLWWEPGRKLSNPAHMRGTARNSAAGLSSDPPVRRCQAGLRCRGVHMAVDMADTVAEAATAAEFPFASVMQ